MVNSGSSRCVPLAGVGGWWSWLHNGENPPHTQTPGRGSDAEHLKLSVHYSQDPWLVCLVQRTGALRGALLRLGQEEEGMHHSRWPTAPSSFRPGQSQVLSSSRNGTGVRQGRCCYLWTTCCPQLPRSVAKPLVHPPFLTGVTGLAWDKTQMIVSSFLLSL